MSLSSPGERKYKKNYVKLQLLVSEVVANKDE